MYYINVLFKSNTAKAYKAINIYIVPLMSSLKVLKDTRVLDYSMRTVYLKADFPSLVFTDGTCN